jgi:DNA mismatch endonuclease (patch repair protein)
MLGRLDPLSPAERSERMSRVRGKNTKPELLVRRLVWSLGYRYRLQGKLPGKPDLVFASKKKAIFIHGCFWHQHKNCRQYRMPRTRLDFWIPKLKGNRQRDKRNQQALRKVGWSYLIVWECELKNHHVLTQRILNFLK